MVKLKHPVSAKEIREQKEKEKEEKGLSTNPKGFDLLFNNEDPEGLQLSPREQTLQKALDELFSTDGIDLKSDINNHQISALTRGYIFAAVYKSPAMQSLVTHILELSVSKNRGGRKEFVKILQNNTVDTEEEKLKLVRRRLID